MINIELKIPFLILTNLVIATNDQLKEIHLVCLVLYMFMFIYNIMILAK